MVWLFAASIITLLVLLGYPLLEVLIWRRLWLLEIARASGANQGEEQTADKEALAKHISKNANMINETEIEDILSDLVMNN